MIFVFMKMMVLFNANRIKISHFDGQRIEAVVGWPDEGQAHYDENEEIQEVVWNFDASQPIADVSLVLEVIALASLLRGDRIEIQPGELKDRLMDTYKWSGERALKAIDDLLNIRIDMIDNGKPADAFFLHF